MNANAQTTNDVEFVPFLPTRDLGPGRLKTSAIFTTPGVLALVSDPATGDVNLPAISRLVERHLAGEWGHIDSEDKEWNDAIYAGRSIGCMYSSFTLASAQVWVMTEKGTTTVLLPEEY